MRAYHHPAHSHKFVLAPPRGFTEVEPDIAGELARLVRLLPEHLLDHRVEIELFAGAAA